jgi:hypothetical protein
MASKISWANSRRLMYGNLLVLTFDRFQSCAFVTVEDRSQIEKDFIISVNINSLDLIYYLCAFLLTQVKPLEKLNHTGQIQINLDEIDFSYPLTMIETMTYFEAYRPVLNALQTIKADQSFPLAPFLLKLTNEMVPPDYIKPTTTYDFTPLLVESHSDVKDNVIIHDTASALHDHEAIAMEDFRISYRQSTQVARKYKSVTVLDKDQWPTSDELHLNPKQREALILALTNKVALIQGRK